MFLSRLKEGQRSFVYVCAGRMRGLTLNTSYGWPEKVVGKKSEDKPVAPPISQPKVGNHQDTILASLGVEAELPSTAGPLHKTLFFGETPLLPRYIITDYLGDDIDEATRLERIDEARSLFGAETEARRGMFELVDVALTIILAESDRLQGCEDLASEAAEILKAGREADSNIDFVLSFVQEAFLPLLGGATGEGGSDEERGSIALSDFVSASATLMATALQVADFVNTGEAPWVSKEERSDGEVEESRAEAQGQNGDEAAEDGSDGQDDTTASDEGS